MGSAAPESTIPSELVGRLERVGKAIGGRRDDGLSGACPGIPQVVMRSIKRSGGRTVGISPAGSLREHRQVFKSPTDSLDVIKMTGTGGGMGFIARERDNIRYSDILLYAGGRSGTLGELVFAMQEPRVVALLEDSTGVTAKARRQILPIIGHGRALVVADRDPERLVDKAVRAAEELLRRQALRGGGSRQLGRRAPARSPASPAASAFGSGLPKPFRASAGLQLGEAERRRHAVFSFFGSSRGMDRSDRSKVKTLAELIARGRPQGREPLLVLPTRRGPGSLVARVARRAGVRTVGISPAGSLEEHRSLDQFKRGLSEIVLTGEGGGTGKLAAYQHCIKPAEVVFVAGGDHQTLGGTIFAMYQPTVLAVLETGGMTGKLRSHILSTFHKPHAAKMIFDSDPKRLYRRAMAASAALRRSSRKPYQNAE